MSITVPNCAGGGSGTVMVMALRFEELAWRATPMGEISLRRRVEPSLGVDVYEVKLGDEYLMSSLFTVAEVALATLGLAAVEVTLSTSWSAVWAWATPPGPCSRTRECVRCTWSRH